MAGKTVTEGMRGDSLGDFCPEDRFSQGFLQGRFVNVETTVFIALKTLGQFLCREKTIAR